MDLEQLAVAAGKSVSQVRRDAAAGRIPGVSKQGGRYVIDESHPGLVTYIAAETTVALDFDAMTCEGVAMIYRVAGLAKCGKFGARVWKASADELAARERALFEARKQERACDAAKLAERYPSHAEFFAREVGVSVEELRASLDARPSEDRSPTTIRVATDDLSSARGDVLAFLQLMEIGTICAPGCECGRVSRPAIDVQLATDWLRRVGIQLGAPVPAPVSEGEGALLGSPGPNTDDNTGELLGPASD
ncbi:MAG: hypothetical protein DHS20C14_21680 [Phycisphaeraceae bacterium]|nr:MAG: hypothetical protein DHS20C14_21680 [Phycisphaeraceae bacterium]